MKLDQLTMFVTVARLGSLSLASAHLNKTQPAISQSIRQLESSFNLSLFNRSGYRLELTEVGNVLYQKATSLLDEANALQQTAKYLVLGNETSITLAIEASFNLKLILPLLENVQNQFPNTQIIIKQEYLTGAFEAIKNKKAILCITPYQEVLHKDSEIEEHFLTNGALVNVASPRLIKRHPNLQSRRELLHEYQIVVQDSGSGFKDTEWGVQDGQRRWYVNDYQTKKMLIESAMGWGKIPDYLAAQGIQNGTLALLKLTDVKNEMLARYHIMKNKSELLGPVAQAVWEQFKHYRFN